MEQLTDIINNLQNDLIKFAQDLVKIKSFTGEEKEIIKFIEKKMLELGYDRVIIDGMGNCIGVIGDGNIKIMFDSHVDTVKAGDAKEWSTDPFGGEIIDGKLYGRGSADMKSALAATVYAGYAIKKLGLHKGKTIYISASVMEEDYDGENLSYIFANDNINPDYVVICEATKCRVCLGQKGRALFKINMQGVSAHGSAPEKGDNPVYKLADVIKRIEDLNRTLTQNQENAGTIALTRIESKSASYNAIPSEAGIYIDRRLITGEDESFIKKEMDNLLAGTDATWEVFQVIGKSWTGQEVRLNSFLPAWEIESDHPLTIKAIKACEKVEGKSTETTKWDFSTNGVASARLGIPTIGYGPGDSKLAHMKDEYCPVEDIVKACRFYAELVKEI